MAHTMIEKIIGKNVGREVTPGEIVTVRVDRVMIHDIFIPFVAEKFAEMGFERIWDPDRVVLIYDHLVPASQVDDVRHFQIGDAFAQRYGLTHVHRSDGICHQLMVEQGYVKPGDVVFGTDSHTTTYGCVGAFSTGIGYTEMAGILGTGELWVRVPETIRIAIHGKLPDHVTSKDVILTIIGDLGADGATYQALEFGGDTIENMTLAGRMTMTNMSVEAGAKCALCAPDEMTAAYGGRMPSGDDESPAGKAAPTEGCVEELLAEEGAAYARELTYRAEDFVPVLACPSQVDKIHPVAEWQGTKIDQVFLGSCTNGRLEDLQMAAEILKGKHVAPFVNFIVTPASRKVYEEAVADGTMAILAAAGAQVTHPGCGLCCGRAGGILTDGQRVVATNNRNFLGRMGTPGVEIFLASPKTAAACAIAGEITSIT